MFDRLTPYLSLVILIVVLRDLGDLGPGSSYIKNGRSMLKRNTLFPVKLRCVAIRKGVFGHAITKCHGF